MYGAAGIESTIARMLHVWKAVSTTGYLCPIDSSVFRGTVYVCILGNRKSSDFIVSFGFGKRKYLNIYE
jgi:hypothetical protein